MDSDDEDEKETPKGPKFPIQMFISEGNKYMRLLKYDKAIEFFNAALEKEPNNEKCLIGRSKCNIRLAKYSEARKDAESVLEQNRKSCEAKLLIGEVDYFLGDFEKAFLNFYRAHELRPNIEGLKFGHQMCRRAIDNALQPDKPMILDDQDISKLSEVDRDSGQTTEMKIAKDFLTPDVEFVETLLEDDVLESIHPDCEYILAYLKDRQQFWRTQNPSTSKTNAKTTNSETKEGKADDFDSLKGEQEIIQEEITKQTGDMNYDSNVAQQNETDT